MDSRLRENDKGEKYPTSNDQGLLQNFGSGEKRHA